MWTVNGQQARKMTQCTVFQLLWLFFQTWTGRPLLGLIGWMLLLMMIIRDNSRQSPPQPCPALIRTQLQPLTFIHMSRGQSEYNTSIIAAPLSQWVYWQFQSAAEPSLVPTCVLYIHSYTSLHTYTVLDNFDWWRVVDKGRKHIRNVGKLSDYTVQHPRIQSPSCLWPWEPEISQTILSIINSIFIK